MPDEHPSFNSQRANSAKPDLIGTVIGDRYLIEHELGRGGMGAVYLARDKPEMMSRPVVVKVLLEDSLKNEWIVRKFHQEIESLARLDDPGVVGIFDAGKLSDGSPYLVIQYVDGVSLRVEIRSGGMGFDRVANIVRQMGRALSAAHERDIIHRDLKPENVMLRRMTSGDEQVKVIDFGIAKVKNSVVAPSTASGAGGVVGTICYMPPEQLQAQRVTPASDIYALGVMAYEMLSGIRPFNPETGFQLLEMQRKGIRVRPKDLRPALPEQAQAVILRALAFDPRHRYQKAREFGDALAEALTDEVDLLEISTPELNRNIGMLNGDDAEVSRPFPALQSSAVDSSRQKTIELAHLLLMEIVGYSQLPNDDRTKNSRALQETLRATTEFTKAEMSNKLISHPTNNGLLLALFSDPDAPVRCARELSKALKNHPDIKLRMGINSGPLNEGFDANGNANVTGDAAEQAQSVMDCGDAGHILLSKRAVDDLGQHSKWQPSLHDLGETQVEHGRRLHVFNFYDDDVGNPSPPTKFRRRKKPALSFPFVTSVLLLAAVGITLLLWRPWSRNQTKTQDETNVRAAVESNARATSPSTERVFTYFLTPSDRGKRIEEERFAGNEQFHNGSKLRFVLIPEQDGALYLLNRGTGPNRAESWNVLFPTPKNNNGSSHVAANHQMEARINFDKYPGDENLAIIWSKEPLPELEHIFKQAAATDFEIKDREQIEVVKEYLKKYGTPEPKPEVDINKKETTVRGSGEVIIRSLVLKHFDF